MTLFLKGNIRQNIYINKPQTPHDTTKETGSKNPG